jgi:hypothetical protein
MSDDSLENVGVQAIPTPAKARPNWLSRVLWMGPRVAEARAKKFGPAKPGFAWFEIARQLCDDVVKIGETGKSSLAVLLLDCDQVGLLVRAYLEREGLLSGTGPLGDADWANALQVPVVAESFAKLTVEQGAMLTAMLGRDRDATLAKLTGEDRESFARAVHGLAMGLSEPLELESNRLGRVLFARWSRVAVAVAVLAVLVGVVGTWMDKKFGKPNLALHRPVTVSSQFPGQGMDHSLLVDGDRDNLGFHTESGGQQWVVIDLGAVHKLNKVVVYNRTDGNVQERAVPLKLEVSKDNKTFTLLKERKETFDKWTVRGLHAEGRYIRLQNTPPNFFHLAEVEVY